MGVVYQATQVGLERDVALKLLSPEFVDMDDYQARFRREAAALARQESPHIVAAYDAGEHDGWLYIATQYIPGQDLQQYLERHGAMPVEPALDVLLQVLDGLAVAHANGIIHRDIKPSNVLLRLPMPPVRAYICDLGISHVIGAEHTKTAGVVGTLGYMAPERHRGDTASAASDLYAVGCLLWALVTGRAPYVGTDYKVADSHLHDPIPTLHLDHGTDRLIQPILTRSMAKDPAHRFASAAEMAYAVRRALDEIRARTGGPTQEDVEEETLRRPIETGELTEVRPYEAVPRPVPPVDKPARSRAGVAVAAALAATIVLVLVIGAVAIGLRGRGGSSASQVPTPTDSSAGGSGAGASSDLASPPLGQTTAAQATPKGSGGAPAPALAGIDAPYRQLSCNGQYVVMLATSGVASETVAKLGAAIDAVPPGAGYAPSYLAGKDSCGAFEGKDPETHALVYDAYLGPFPTLDAACQTLASLPSETAWVRQLANPSKIRELCMCITPDSVLPVLDGSVPSSQSLVVRRAIASFQWALFALGLNAKESIYGNYTDEFVSQVRGYQSGVGLAPTGVVDAVTWHTIKASYCPAANFLVPG